MSDTGGYYSLTVPCSTPTGSRYKNGTYNAYLDGGSTPMLSGTAITRRPLTRSSLARRTILECRTSTSTISTTPLPELMLPRQ